MTIQISCNKDLDIGYPLQTLEAKKHHLRLEASLSLLVRYDRCHLGSRHLSVNPMDTVYNLLQYLKKDLQVKFNHQESSKYLVPDHADREIYCNMHVAVWTAH